SRGGPSSPEGEPTLEQPDGRRCPMKVLYLAATGASDATRASIPLHVAANGSVEAGQECAVVLVGAATELVSRETAERVEGVGVPPVRDLVRKLVANQVPVFV